MKHFYLGALYLLVSYTNPLYSQEINLGPRVTALGNIGVALSDVWSIQSNQSGLAFLQKPTASISYRNSYLSSELHTQSAVFAYPFGRNVLGLSFQSYGFTAYSEQKIGFTYAKRFGNNVSAALNLNFHQVDIPSYGSVQTYSVEAGLQYKVNESLILGTHISNPGMSNYDVEVQSLIPVSLEFGGSYRFSDKVLLNTGFVKVLDSTSDFRCGLEYSVIDWLAFRGGVSVNPFRQFAGLGYQFKDLKIDVGASTHPYLGFSPQIALSYEF